VLLTDRAEATEADDGRPFDGVRIGEFACAPFTDGDPLCHLMCLVTGSPPLLDDR